MLVKPFSESDTVIRKVKDAYGWLGNMSPHPVVIDGEWWPTTEALFQAMRFDNAEIRGEIKSKKSPMTAKMTAKKHKDKMIIEPLSASDIDNMRTCLKLKIDQHPLLKEDLVATGDRFIVEDCTKRQLSSGLFWGAALVDGEWRGDNVLGGLWMERRIELIACDLLNVP